jgi:tRNA dimethylallyltransferase
MTADPSQIRNTPQVWLLAGPTASGKSALALDLARRLGGEIVNADALQIYRDLRILTARPGVADESAVRHHLYGSTDGAEVWSVGRWLSAAQAILNDIAARGRVAIVTGGTGLYFRALTEGLADIPPVPVKARIQAQSDLATRGEEAFRVDLAKIDPAATARIAPGDRQRLTRAMEVWLATGRSLSHWQAASPPGLAPSKWRGLVLEPPRDVLHARCEARVVQMVQAGVLDEVAALMNRNLPADRPVQKALGYRAFADHLAGRLTLEDAVTQAQAQTRRYVKRQSTWLRTQMTRWQRLHAPFDLNQFEFQKKHVTFD